MADLLARFKLVDEMSEKLSTMAEHGQNIVNAFEDAGDAANAIFDGIESGVTSAVSTIDGVAHSITEFSDAANSAASSTGDLSEALEDYGDAAGDAAGQAGEAADAISEQEQMFQLCEKSAAALTSAIEASSGAQADLENAMQSASETAEELANNENVSAEAKEALARAAASAEDAMRELEAAQREAADAMSAYDATLTSGTNDLGQLEAAAERAMHAAENLASANQKAAEVTDELGKAAETASHEAEEGGSKGIGAVEGIASALAAAGITAKLKEITESVYELADAFSEAESIVVKATGATGAALDGLMESTMQVYATAKSGDLSAVSGAIGEINTRMLLTGDALTDVTGKFMDYANITGTNVVGSVQNVTKVMNQWGVEGKDVESVLDRLAYAGQISGASVDSLSSTLITGAASFQQAGLTLDNTIQMLADFELAGINGTTAITAMRTAVNNFSNDGRDANIALQETITKIAAMENQSEATALAVETFGSRAGQQLAAAIQRGTISVETFNSTLEAADGTLAKAADAAQTLSQKWDQASRGIQAAFTSAVEPTLSKVSSGFANISISFGKFLQEHPAVTKAITAIGVGLGAATLGIAGMAAASLTAIPAVAALGTAISAAIWPLTAVAAGIAAVTAAVLILKGNYDDAYEETMSMTASTARQTEQLAALEEEYERAVETFGETSEEASRLRYQIDDLSSSLSQNGQSVADLVAECDNMISKHNELMTSFDDTTTSISNEELKNLALIQKLSDLASASEQTAGSQQAMQAIVDQLNGSLNGVRMTYEDLISNQDAAVQSLRQYAQAQAEQARQQSMLEEYVALIQQQADEQAELAKVTDEVSAAQDRAAAASQAYMDKLNLYTGHGANAYGAIGMIWSDEKANMDAANDALEEVTAKETELSDALAETEKRLAEIESAWGDVADATQETEEATVSYEQAAQAAFQSVQTEIEELCQAYDDAYQAALSSFEGQFGLFDTATTESEAYMNANV